MKSLIWTWRHVVCITAFWREKISLHSNSLVNMADNVNDKGDSRTIQEIVRAVVANLRVVFRKIRTSAWHVTWLIWLIRICIQYLGNHSKTTCQKSAKSTRYCQAEVRILRKTTLKFATTALTISWIVLESPLFEWRKNLFAPKCSYANIPYVKCSKTLIVSGSCVFLLPLPFELKFWFFEFEYVTRL